MVFLVKVRKNRENIGILEIKTHKSINIGKTVKENNKDSAVLNKGNNKR